MVSKVRSLGAASGLVLLAGVLSGCPYGFSSSLLPGHIKSLAVPLMENRTDRGELSSALADSLTEAFIDDHTLKVVGEKTADSVLEGTIAEYRWEPFTVDANENILEYKIEIVLEVRFVDVRKNKVLWEEKNLSQWDTYRFSDIGGQESETEETGIGRVLAKLTDDILNRTVEGW
jgi:hypothetical protein